MKLNPFRAEYIEYPTTYIILYVPKYDIQMTNELVFKNILLDFRTKEFKILNLSN